MRIVFIKTILLTLLLSVVVILGIQSVEGDRTTFKGGIFSYQEKEKGLHSFLITQKGKIVLDIAKTEGDRMRGLSGRETLSKESGMLFVFPVEGIYAFWMKDMNFAIDILWLDTTFKVVHIEEGVEPDTYPAHFVSSLPAKYVLEMYSGFVEDEKIVVGQSLFFENIK